MEQKMHLAQRKFLLLGSVILLGFLFNLAGCSAASRAPVIYEDYATLQQDCPVLLADHQAASISGALNVRDTTLCITDQDGERCQILLGYEQNGLDIWMETGGKNGMDRLPDPYKSYDLVVTADDGQELGYNDQVTVRLEPFNDPQDGEQVCSFRVQTILRSKIVAAEGQPGEGAVNLDVPANLPWFDSGIYVNQGQRILFVPGFESYNLQDNNPNWDAMSYDMYGISETVCETNCAINGQDYGRLVARIGDGQPFLVTQASSEFTLASSGELYLAVNDCADCYADNSGNFDLVVYLYNEP